VLLGDTLELRHGPLQQTLGAAGPVLAELGRTLGSEREVVIVPGNHDHMLLRAWFERRAVAGDPPPLGLSSEVEWRDGDALGAVAGFLRPARVRVAYPGVWLREDVYATHGHYGDRHNPAPIIERLGAGMMARLVPEVAGGPVTAEDYEATLRPMYAWIDAVAQGRVQERGHDSMQVRMWRDLTGPASGGRLRRAGLRGAFPVAVAALNRARLGPLEADVSAPRLRQAGLRGFGTVVDRLRIHASYVLFGHTHRAGPLPGDEPGEWTAPSGASMINTGSWISEPSFVGADAGSSPYRPGFCVIVEDPEPASQPVLRNLLD
jgi:hypothetical protein